MIGKIFKPSLDWLLVFVPAAFVLRYAYHGEYEVWLFVCACLAIIPLAGWMGRATEELAHHLGEGMGGLLNATFGNAAELIIALIALSKGMTEVVKASLTGSILGNILLVLGASMVAGGVKYSRQTFNRTAAAANTTSLTLAAIALVIPAVFHHASSMRAVHETDIVRNRLSLGIAGILFVMYGFTLLFSLKTHAGLFLGESHGESTEEGKGWSVKKSTAVLVCATVFVALISEFLVGTVEAAQKRFGLSEVFVGVIVVAIIGNAAEHSTAVTAAWKNKMDLSLGIAIGSSLQIALFVAPVLVFISQFFEKQLDLEFSLAEIAAVVMGVHIVGQVSSDGESNWLEGTQLLLVYAILGMLFYFLPVG